MISYSDNNYQRVDRRQALSIMIIGSAIGKKMYFYTIVEIETLLYCTFYLLNLFFALLFFIPKLTSKS